MTKGVVILLFVFNLICICSFSQAYQLEIEEVEGRMLPFKPKAVFSGKFERKEALRAYLERLQTEGYLSAGVDSILEVDDKQKAFIFLGNQYKWEKLRIIDADANALASAGYRRKLYTDRPFRLKATQRMMKKILVHYENHGYPFARVRFDSLRINQGVLQAGIKVDKGELIRIDSVTHKGDAKISDRYLYNYIGVQPGDLYNESVLANLSTRLKELPFITETRPAEVFLMDEAALVRMHLKSKKASSFNGIIGFLPNNDQSGRLLLTGEANLRLKNALGKGEGIIAEWRRLQTATQSINIEVAWPFLFNTRLGVDGRFNLYKRDTTFLNLQQSFGIQYLMRGTNYIKVFFDNRRSSLLSTRGLENLITLPDYADTRTGTYGLEISLAKLDYRLNPRKGYRILARLGAGNRRIDKNPALNPQVYDGLELNSIQYSGFLDADLFIPIKDRSVITPGILSGAITGSSIFENELYRIGGNNTLRGFDEESIFASIYSIINLEYRYLLEENSFLFLFANAAYYENTAINRSISDRPYGFGAGMSFETKAGIFTISYALGSQFGNPVETRTAKVHFGITSLF